MMRFGLIGYGAIGRFRAEALAKTPGAELAMVVDVKDENRAQAASQWRVATTDSIDAMVSRNDIDVVIVSTPPNIHRPHCEQALTAGKHVLCEKPLASTVEDCEAIVSAARDANRVLATGFNYRFYPAVVKAREIIGAGGIGDIDHVRGYAGHPGGPEFTHPWVHDPSIMGGGALMDNGIHAADLTLHFLGEVCESSGFASDRVWGFGRSEDNGFVLMRTADNRVGTLHASWSEWRGYRFRVEIFGTHGCIVVSYPPMLTVHYKRPEGGAKKGSRRVHLFPLFQVKERLKSYRYTVVQSFIAEHLALMERIAGRQSACATGEDGLNAVRLAHSAYGERMSDVKASSKSARSAVHG